MGKYAAGKNTKQNIITAAGELIAERGVDNVSTRAVADSSGENIGSIHYHFGGKDALFEAVVQDAINGCQVGLDIDIVVNLGDSPSIVKLSEAVRSLIAREINDMFRADRPIWHSQVIYQLLQRDDALYELFRAQILVPGMDTLTRFFRLVDPNMTEEDTFLHSTTMKLPIFAHANYRKALLGWLGTEEYSDEYLKKLENLLVKKTQLSLGLPED